MEKPKSNKILWILIAVGLVLVAGAVFGVVYIPSEMIYRDAARYGAELPFEQAYAALEYGADALRDKPMFAEKRNTLLEQTDALLTSFADEAMQESRTLPYAEARQRLADAVLALEQKPGTDALCEALRERSDELVYENAMDESRTLPFAEACGVLRGAIAELQEKPSCAERCGALNERLSDLINTELDRRIETNDTEAVRELILSLPPEQAGPVSARIYENAAALEAQGKKTDALALFLLLGSYSDAEARAEALERGRGGGAPVAGL